MESQDNNDNLEQDISVNNDRFFKTKRKENNINSDSYYYWLTCFRDFIL